MLYKILRAIIGVLFRILYRIELVNGENLKKDGKLIICANHIHDFDPVIISVLTKNQIFWMAKKELFENKIFGKFLSKLGAFPVDRESAALSTLKHSMKILKEGNILGIFPEGTRVKKMDLENAKPGVVLISTSTKTPILPVYIDTTYRPFSKIRIVVGEKMEFYKTDEKISKDDYKELGERVLKEIYRLKN